jgi:DMSO/TMAO reductase YedYZ molybdopterin-dependent catalytic subunit
MNDPSPMARARAAMTQASAPAVLAAAAGLLTMAVTRAAFALPMPPELAADRATVLIPLTLFEALLKAFGPNAKHLLLAGLTLGYGVYLLLCCLLWWAFREHARAAWPRVARWVAPAALPGPRDGLGVIVTHLALGGLILSPLVGGGIFGVSFAGGAAGALGSVILPAAVSAITFYGLMRVETAPGSAGQQSSRRAFLRQSALVAGVAGGAVFAWQFISGGGGVLGGGSRAGSGLPLGTLPPQPDKIVPPPTPNYGSWVPVASQTPELTSTGDFYYVAKDIIDDPTIDGKTWRLQIGGLVDHPYSLSYAQLQALPPVSRYHTLECISNDVGGTLMSNGLFVGTRLADVLMQAGLKPSAAEVIFEAQDGYSDSLTLAQALDQRSLIAYSLDGAALPVPHGYPARLLIPGLYGMKNGKWLTKLTVGSGGYQGYWEQRGWTPIARVKTTTRIDLPADGDHVPVTVGFIAGVAYAADRGIARVDVSLDSGQSWQEATLKRPLGDLTWVLWELPWQPTPGAYTIMARAVEADGTVQTTALAPTLPDGASGYHTVQVRVG